MANVLNYLNGVHDYFGLGQQPAAARGFGSGFLPIFQPAFASAFGGRDVQVTSVHVDNPAMLREIRNQRREDREDDRASTAACIGGIATIVLSGLSALALRGYCNDRKELKKAEEFKVWLRLEPVETQREVEPIVNNVIEVLETKVARGRNIMVLTGLALATGIAAFVGGMASIQWLITASIIAGVAVAAIGVFLVVWHCTENTSLSPEMAHKVETLRHHFRG